MWFERRTLVPEPFVSFSYSSLQINSRWLWERDMGNEDFSNFFITPVIWLCACVKSQLNRRPVWLVHLLRQELPYRLKIFHLVHYYVIVRRLYTECLEDSKQLLKAVTGVSLFLFFQPFDLVLRKKMKAKNWLKTSIERSYKTRVSLEALKRFTISNSRAN